jgi:hypothetical protein
MDGVGCRDKGDSYGCGRLEYLLEVVLGNIALRVTAEIATIDPYI